jgi:magnesium-transporting ATPase (P-type)
VEINSEKQLMYRGTRLKNTKWIYGLVFLTGRNTKIIMNSKSEASKMSQIEIKVNYILIGILVIQTIFSIMCAIAYGIFRNLFKDDFTYINWPNYNVVLDSFLIFLSYFVLLNTMIPISLIVSIEIVKYFQMIFIKKDKLLYSSYRQRGVTVKSASLNEELGQI